MREITIAEKTVYGRSNSKHFPGTGRRLVWLRKSKEEEELRPEEFGRETGHTGISRILRSCWALLGKFAKILIYILQKVPLVVVLRIDWSSGNDQWGLFHKDPVRRWWLWTRGDSGHVLKVDLGVFADRKEK